MRAVVQRVSRASVVVEEKTVGDIGGGLMALVGVQVGDAEADVEYIAGKLAGLRIFEDEEGKLNRSVEETGGALLLVSQFTLLGETRKGRRPSFIEAARPEEAQPLFSALVERLRAQGLVVETGVFGAHMAVSLVNDGPVTVLLESRGKA